MKKLPIKFLKTAIIISTYLWITSIANIKLGLKAFPFTWKTTEIILIHKAEKPKQKPVNYKSISPLSAVSKLIDKNNAFLPNEYFRRKVYNPNQFWFRHSHSTLQHVTRIVEDVTNDFTKKLSTGRISFDLENVLERLSHEALIVKLNRINIVRINVLGAILFNDFIADIPSTQYADDTAVYTSSTHPWRIKYLQTGTKTLWAGLINGRYI